MTLAIKTATSRTEENLKALVQRFQVRVSDERNERILQWLAAPDPSWNHNKACQTKQRETGRWFIESANYINWTTLQSSFLWLHGIPGCGKTVLCSTVVEDIASRCQVGGRKVLAYYYFDFNESKKQTCEGLLRSLVTQLFGQTAWGSETIEVLFSDCGEGQREPTPKGLVQALRQLSEPLEETYFVFDALDECVEIPAVISFLEDIRGWHNHNLHILITSRKEMAIEKGFRSLTTDQIQFQNFLVDADVRLLVRECLRSDPELSRWPESIKAEIEKTLYEGSKGIRVISFSTSHFDLLNQNSLILTVTPGFAGLSVNWKPCEGASNRRRCEKLWHRCQKRWTIHMSAYCVISTKTTLKTP